MFDANANPAVNYGVIGHELTHGFDDQDRELDVEGKLGDSFSEPARQQQKGC